MLNWGTPKLGGFINECEWGMLNEKALSRAQFDIQFNIHSPFNI